MTRRQIKCCDRAFRRLSACVLGGVLLVVAGCSKAPGKDVPTNWKKVCATENFEKNVAVTGYAMGLNRTDTKSVNFEVSADEKGDSSMTVTVNVDRAGKKNTANFTGNLQPGKSTVSSFILNDGTTVPNSQSQKLVFHGKVDGVQSQGKWCYLNVYRIDQAK